MKMKNLTAHPIGDATERIAFGRPLLVAVLVLALFLAAGTPAIAQITAPGGDTPHARGRLIADVKSIQPGRPFHLGFLFDMDPGWHIYWANNGDAGLPTNIAWELPEGFSAGPIQWPVPERIEAGGLITYGYHGEVLLFAKITPPGEGSVASGPLGFSAKSDWLVCEEICVPGDAAGNLQLAFGDGAPSAEASIFRKFAGRLPQRTLFDPGKVDLEEADWPLGINARVVDPKPVPGEPTQWTLEFAPRSPWRFDVAAKGDQAAGVFPLVPRKWKAGHAEAVQTAPESIVFSWSPQPRKRAKPTEAYGNLEDLDPSLLLRAVVRLPLINPQTNERKASLFTVARAAEVASPDQAAAGVAPLPPPAVEQPTEPAPAGSAPDQQADAGATTGLSFLGVSEAAFPLWLMLIYAFIGGVILNIMPCVLPVVSLKVLGFVRQSGEDPRRVLLLGLTYAAGVLVSFLALALAVIGVQTAGSQVGWGFQMQEPRFVIVMATIVLVFGLSLLGVFTIDLPGSAASGMGAAARREGLGGSFFNGVLATALATPCTAPFLGVALGFAFSQSSGVVVLFFLTIGAGLAAPYVLLAIKPAWLRALPKPGPWMETFKQLMGFLLLATLVWLLHVLGQLIDAAGLTWTLAYLVAVGLGCWIVGKGLTMRAGRRRMAWVSALLLVAIGYAAFPGRYLKGFEQRISRQVETGPAPTALANHGLIQWEPFSVDRIEQLVADGRTVFVDFTAEWCITCKFNERTVLETERIRTAFETHEVVPLKADWTSRDETIGAVLRQFGRSGVPLYVIFPAGRASDPIVLPTVIRAGMIEENLKEADARTIAASG